MGRTKKGLLAAGAAALLMLPAMPASASTTESCALGSPNIVRDVTDCVAYLLTGCNPGGSPNIVRDLLDCLPG